MEKSEKKINWKPLFEKMKMYPLAVAIFPAAVFIIFLMLPNMGMSLKRRKEIEEMKTKLKYFKPTLEEGFWGKKVTWEMRDTPLTDEQLENL